MINVNDVSYNYVSKYHTVEALKNVSCKFENGMLYSIIGPSGSGKTTLLSLLAGLDLPTSGEIFIDNVSMSSMDRDKYRREQAAVIYQSFNLFPLLTAKENIMFPMLLKGMNKAEAGRIATEYAEDVGLREVLLSKRPLLLSGGEQQRVAIARALAIGGDILLADEPTGNLDEENGKVIMSILKRLTHENDYLCIMITHNTEMAEQSDRVYAIKDGRVVS
ncbi:MAG: ABC transporter ATP-binding protein [Clostridiales Family XIII bacterium]|jgi:ABC-type lipoprotein export system ATPase subunit|nr:ABC transporter ATP-binding protein [Clostridiales Family XIII bacterium]